MKKQLYSLIILSLVFGLFSCSKKVTTFNYGKPYYEHHTAVTENTSVPETETVQEEITASAEVTPNLNTAPAVIISPKAKAKETPELAKAEKSKLSLKEKVAVKILNKKIEKLEKGGGLSSNMKLGIILAAVGILLLILSIIGGGVGFVFFLLGLIGLVAGLLIILLAALDVI